MNHSTSKEMQGGWGVNWDAFNDCLANIENGGIWGTAKKIQFPLRLVIHHSKQFEENHPGEFAILTEILNSHIVAYASQGNSLTLEYVNSPASHTK